MYVLMTALSFGRRLSSVSKLNTVAKKVAQYSTISRIHSRNVCMSMAAFYDIIR